MVCLNREGKRQCTWWLRGHCYNPQVSKPVKQRCNGKLLRYRTSGIEITI
jgi:hypothetical protein